MIRPSVAVAQYKIEGWPVRKIWGPLRSASAMPDGTLLWTFEDQAGTIRVIRVALKPHTAEIVGEFKRD
jgi:hypothetical protein